MTPQPGSEKALYRSLREWLFRTYGRFVLAQQSGELLTIKLSTLGRYGEGGWPDMAVFVRGPPGRGSVFFVEFKNPNGTGRLSPLQAQRHAELAAMGFEVLLIDGVESGREMLRQAVTTRLRAAGQAKASEMVIDVEPVRRRR